MKYGILMMAHNNTEVVKTCFRMLDDERFQLYLTLDRLALKNAGGVYEIDDFIPKLKCTNVSVLRPAKIYWGGYSSVKANLCMMKKAVEDGCDRLIFLQGADLPLKTPDEIDTFYQAHRNDNYFPVFPNDAPDNFVLYLVRAKHYFVENRYYRRSKLLKAISHTIARLSFLFVDKTEIMCRGSALYSITGEFASYVLQNEKEIEKQYRYSLAPDENYLHNLIDKSHFKDTWIREWEEDCRLIDRTRMEGNSPHCFTMQDEEMLRNAIENDDRKLFCRKFQETRDLEIVRLVEGIVMGRDE